MKFLHAADLHVDSPLRGLQFCDASEAQTLRNATRDALRNLVTLAIEQQVDFVIIAGDLFDGPWQDMQTGIWTADQFRRLNREHITVYLLRGNHDAASKVRQTIRWPENVRSFSVRHPESFVDASLGVAIHGQGFADPVMDQDVAAGYPEPVPETFNIGVLHTSLTGDPQHDPYAPTSPDVLIARGYDYWALGHVHTRSDPPISQRPYIAFAGNTQGRHIRETGPKGCLLVTVTDGELDQVEFCPTDTVRWHLVEVSLTETDGLHELYALVRQRLIDCHQQADGRFCAVRLVIRGSCRAHQSLASRAEREQAIAEIRNLANDLDEEVWVEKIQFATAPLVDLEQLRHGTDLIGDLLRTIDRLAQDDDELIDLSSELSGLSDKWALELKDAGIDPTDTAQLRGWVRQAEGLLVTQLLEKDA